MDYIIISASCRSASGNLNPRGFHGIDLRKKAPRPATRGLALSWSAGALNTGEITLGKEIVTDTGRAPTRGRLLASHSSVSLEFTGTACYHNREVESGMRSRTGKRALPMNEK
jgi:hypothetical protein